MNISSRTATTSQAPIPDHPLAPYGYSRPPFWLWRFSPRAFVTVAAIKDMLLIITGRCSLHRAWQAGHDHGTQSEYQRIIINGGDLVPYVTALREARGALWEMWPAGKEASFPADPAVKAIDAIIKRGPWIGGGTLTSHDDCNK